MSKTTPLRVLLMDTEFNTHNRYLTLAIRDALSRTDNVSSITLSDYGNVVRDAQTGAFDLFLAFGGGGGGTDHVVLHRAARFCRFSVLWTSEDPYTVDENVEVSCGYDLTATNDLASLGRYERAIHLPLAAAADWCLHTVRQDDHELLYDVFFLGNPWPNRVRVLSRLVSALGAEMRFKIGLPTNGFIPRYEVPGFDAAATNWRASLIDFCRFANRSRVVLTLPRSFTASRGGQPSAVTPGPRLFETALAGTCQLIQESGEEVTRYFDKEREVATFSDPEEGVEKLRWLVKNARLRHAMATASQNRALAKHTYIQRIDQLLSVVNERIRPSARFTKAIESGAQGDESNIGAAKTQNVLFISHNVVGEANWGGIEVYQKQLSVELRLYNFSVFVFFPILGRDGKNYLCLLGPNGTHINFERGGDPYSRLILNPSEELIFAKILRDYSIKLVHVQHLIGHSMGLPVIARALGVPVVFTIHDYYLMCDEPALFGYDQNHCYIYERSPEQCEICLPAMFGVPAGSQVRRKHAMRRTIRAVDSFVASTPRSLQHVMSFYPEIAQRAIILPMAFQGPLAALSVYRPLPSAVTKGTLRVLIPGNFTKHKGARALLTVIKVLAGEDIFFRVIGRIDEPFRTEVANLSLSNAEFVGPYEQENFGSLAGGFDVSIHYSVWPETYCITLSESMFAGLVPIVSDIGALADRVRHYENGLKVKVGDIGAIVHHLRALAGDRTLLNDLKNGRAPSDMCTVRDHVRTLVDIYKNLTLRFPLPEPTPVRLEFRRAPCVTVERVDPQRVNHPRWDSDEIVFDRLPEFSPMVRMTKRGAFQPEGQAKFILRKLCRISNPIRGTSVVVTDGELFCLEGELQNILDIDPCVEIEFDGLFSSRVACTVARNSGGPLPFSFSATARNIPEGFHCLRLLISSKQKDLTSVDLGMTVAIVHAKQLRPVYFDPAASSLLVREGGRKAVYWDEIKLDGVAIHAHEHRFAIRGMELVVTGWAVDLATGFSAQCYYLSLHDSARNVEYTIMCEPYDRRDLAEFFGNTEFIRAGFQFAFRCTDLPEGSYLIGLIARVDDELVRWKTDMSFEVIDSHACSLLPVATPISGERRVNSAIPLRNLEVCGHSISCPSDLVVGGNYLEISGDLPLERDQIVWPDIQVLLEGAQVWSGRAVRRFISARGPVESDRLRFIAVVSLAPLGTESFVIRIAVDDKTGSSITPALCRVIGPIGPLAGTAMIVDEIDAFSEMPVDGSLDCFGSILNVHLPFRSYIDIMPGVADISGWVSLPNYDPTLATKPLHLVLSSPGTEEVVSARLYRIRRPDVHAQLDKNESWVVGFQGLMEVPVVFRDAKLTLLVGSMPSIKRFSLFTAGA